jgi:hypothetical protein
LNDAPVEFERSGFVISTDRSRIEPDTALSLLHSTFWARGMDRGRGLGRWLSECMLAHRELQHPRGIALLTRDAESMFAAMGFTVGPGPLI